MKYRTNFAILGMIHQHMILFMKCHFLSSGELCVNHIHIGLNWISEYCFHCHNMSLRECFFGSSSHQNGDTKSNDSLLALLRVWINISTVEHSATNFEVDHIGYKVNCRIKNVCEIQLPFEIKAFCCNHNGYNIICAAKIVGRGHRVCKNTKGITNRKRLRNTALG